ncbi:MAG: tRNA-dihydrouridine synthase family protein [Spirochaetota bacterium]
MPILYLAPLHGVSNRVFRQAYFRHFVGFDAAMAPFIQSVKAGSRLATHFKDLLPGYDTHYPVIPQILGNNASDFVDTARVMADLGYREVNWNLGCPYPMVTGKGRGSGLLPHPERIDAFLDQVCAVSPIPVSVKLRLGYKDPLEILALMPVFNAHPLARVIMHPRLASQMYEGQVDLDGFGQALALSLHPVMYNGDIRDLQTYKALTERFPGIQQWMLGRGAISDPFLPGRIKGLPDPAAPEAIIKSFHDELLDTYREQLSGQKHVMDKMKEVWTFLGPWFSPDPRWLGKIAKARTLSAYQSAVQLAFSDPGRPGKPEWVGRPA